MSAIDNVLNAFILMDDPQTEDAIAELGHYRAERKETAEILREVLDWGGFELNDGISLRDAYPRVFVQAATLLKLLEAE